ncbi:hypothetical protein Kpho01_73920 [Kitasatospora phosalacinea]|uniref:Uncharacterized protein n=1 Tax=Kitasatospora phosalacinea TaxID=2065 RepID=A0A9W6UTR1_9ACTN|nr:hypothetical protein Kpho01_73920 [Kitasatospora phosalacinea]
MTGGQFAPAGPLGAPQQSAWQKHRLLRTAVLTAGGAVLLVSGVPNAVELREVHRRPVLRMTADYCVTVTASGESTVVCLGRGGPGDSGVTAGDWTLRDLPEARPSGTVLPVQCDPDGRCASPWPDAGTWSRSAAPRSARCSSPWD